MPLPQHRNPEDNQRTACAPYNFVPLPDVVVPADGLPDHDRYQADHHSGFFDVQLETQSPLYIRGPLTRLEWDRDQQERYIDDGSRMPREHRIYHRMGKNKADFFYVDEQTRRPVIPGSSLRGVLRMLLEIVTYSRFSRFSDRQIIYRAVGDTTSLGASYRQKTIGDNQDTQKTIGDNQDTLPQMRFEYPLNNLKGGYLIKERGDWKILPALEPGGHGESFVHVECAPTQGLPVPYSVVPVSRSTPSRSNPNLSLNLAYATTTQGGHGHPPPFEDTWLIKTLGVGGLKHMQCAVYLPDWSAEPIAIPQEMVTLYQEDAAIPRNNATSTRDLFAEYETTPNRDPQNRPIVPLFYLLNSKNELVYFGSTMMFRLPYQKSIADCVPRDLSLPRKLDFADAMFGFVRTEGDRENPDQDLEQAFGKQGSKSRAYASRVAISDAQLVEGQHDWWLVNDQQGNGREITPKILASPKPTCFQHYLVQENTDRAHLSHYDSPTRVEVLHQGVSRIETRGGNPFLRGTKLFWHQGVPTANMISQQTQDTSTQHTKIKPLKAGVKFTFRIWFDNLTESELGALCWVLRPIGPNAHSAYCHKIGMGKPYGLGAIKLTPKLTLIRRDQRYQSLFNNKAWNSGEESVDQARWDDFLGKFESVMAERLQLASDTRLYQIKRIAMLLRMMQWPGQPPQKPQPGTNAAQQQRTINGQPNTRYMTIEVQGNEYRNRPVLPDPSDFIDHPTRVSCNRVPTLSYEEDIPDDDTPPPSDPLLDPANQSPGVIWLRAKLVELGQKNTFDDFQEAVGTLNTLLCGQALSRSWGTIRDTDLQEKVVATLKTVLAERDLTGMVHHRALKRYGI